MNEFDIREIITALAEADPSSLHIYTCIIGCHRNFKLRHIISTCSRAFDWYKIVTETLSDEKQT